MYKKAFPFLILAILLYGCGGSSQPATEITIEASDFSYTPSSISIPVGQPVVLTINNIGQVEHDFVVDKIDVTDVFAENSASSTHNVHDMDASYDLHVSTGAGQTSVLEFTALEPGIYNIFCSVEGHIEAGMSGELVVTNQ